MAQRLVIIDGKSVFYRGYYAMPNLSTKDGRPTGGVYGFAVMALEIVKKLKPNYVAVAWDKRHTNIRSRRALYPQYKANRKPAPEDFYDQVEILIELLKSLGWPLYEADDYEADDLMGAFAKQAGQKGIESFLITSDLDVLQLVNAHTHIYTLKTGLSNIELFDVAHFEEKYGVGAHQWVDVKALKGDSSDNIPGVAGIGEKTALELISQYKTLDGVYEHLDLLKPTLRDKLAKDKDMAYLSKKLVTLLVDAPVKLDFDKAKLHDGVTPEFVTMLRDLEFRALLRQVESAMSAEERRSAEAEHRVGLAPAKKIPFKVGQYAGTTPCVVALSPDSTELWISNNSGTYSEVSLVGDGDSDAGGGHGGTPAARSSASTVGEVLPDRTRLTSLGLATAPVIGHNVKAVFRALLALGIEPTMPVAHDTRVAAFLLNSLTRALELSDLLGATIELDNPGQVMAAIWKLYEEQTAALAKLPHVQKLARDLDFPMIPLLAKIEHRGILLDSKYLETMSKEFVKKIGALERNIYAHAGQEFNISSPTQLATILFDKLGLPTDGVKKGKTGYSTGALELAKLRELHPIVDLITQYREYTKLKSTYIDALPKLVDEHGKLHTTFDLDVAATGRLSSHDPNLQNIPTRTDLGHAIRTAFVPATGKVFVSADYSQFELRLAAYMAHDQPMIDDFNKGVDVHTATAAQIYNVPLDKVTKDQRRHAKTVNFAVLYGMSPHGLSAATGMSFGEAREFIAKYFEVRAPIRDYIQKTLDKALKEGYVETIFGRRRPTPDLKSSNFAVREAAKRAAQNMPIQGTEADLMKMAMLKVETALDGLGEQILQIHDSILVECPAKNAPEVERILKETMESIHTLDVKLVADVHTGENWGEL
ncbi:MAG TPA: DNA polymerase I [Candidatus Saccharimonadales bacterium]|nr:DNA polymerase I [Candidatus Saccharimonadales bacterium]